MGACNLSAIGFFKADTPPEGKILGAAKKMLVGTVTMSNSYATDGDTLDLSSYFSAAPDAVIISAPGIYLEYKKGSGASNGKVKAYNSAAPAAHTHNLPITGGHTAVAVTNPTVPITGGHAAVAVTQPVMNITGGGGAAGTTTVYTTGGNAFGKEAVGNESISLSGAAVGTNVVQLDAGVLKKEAAGNVSLTTSGAAVGTNVLQLDAGVLKTEIAGNVNLPTSSTTPTVTTVSSEVTNGTNLSTVVATLIVVGTGA